MDKEEQKKVALAAADKRVTDATAAVESAKAALKTAQDAKDDAKIKDAEGKVSTAETAVSDAQAAKTAIEVGDVDDLVDDATGDKKNLHSDGTPKDKDIVIAHDKFKDLSEKAKLFEQFGPALAKLKNDPKLMESIMAGDDPSKSLADRVKRIEEGQTAAKRAEVKTVISKAITTWPDFRSRWEEIKPILAGIEAQGIAYAEAVQRAYFAVNPDAVKQQARLVQQHEARARENDRGRMGPPGAGGGGGSHTDDSSGEDLMNDSDREFAQKMGIDPKLYSKHADVLNRFKDL